MKGMMEKGWIMGIKTDMINMFSHSTPQYGGGGGTALHNSLLHTL